MIDNKTIRKVIMLNKILKGGSPTYEDREASGAVANFTTNTVQPFVSVDCEILPKQEGTGDPSPSNPRPIIGTSTLAIYHSGADTRDYDTISVLLGRTIYGGSAEVVGGEGEVTLEGYDLGDLNWQTVGSGDTRFFVTTGTQDEVLNDASDICEIYERVNVTTTTTVTGFSVTSNGQLRIRDNSYVDATAFTAGVTGKKIVLKLATPTDFTFTGQPINSFEGVNNVWCDTGDIEVTYKYKTGEGGSSKKKYLPIFYNFYGKE